MSADNSPAEVVGKLGLGIGVGFALYFLVTGLGFGGRGDGTGDSVPVPPSAPPPRLPDAKRLSFVMQEPAVVGHPTAFRLRDDDPSTKTYTLEETIARIKAGGRSDMNLRIRGGVIQGAVDKATALLKAAGITVWKEDGPSAPPAVVGNARGRYGNRSVW